jgi:hypothetical protein
MSKRFPKPGSPLKATVTALAGVGMLLTLAAAAGSGGAEEVAHQEADLLRELATNGDAGAQLQLGLAYRDGRDGLTADAATGLHWLDESARQGNAYAADRAANAYAQGEGTQPDMQQAMHWWQVAAQGGNADAQRHLGRQLLAQGRTDAALRWLRRAADSGDAGAHDELVQLYRRSLAPEDDLRRGRSAVAALGVRLNEPSLETFSAVLDTVERSSTEQQSAATLIALADQGDPSAEYQLGLHYRNGDWAVRRDPRSSECWLERAAADGNRLALDAVGSPSEL